MGEADLINRSIQKKSHTLPGMTRRAAKTRLPSLTGHDLRLPY
jgi:hypothetical protein